MQQAKQKCSNLFEIEWEVLVAMETEINERFSIVTDHNVKKRKNLIVPLIHLTDILPSLALQSFSDKT